MCGTVKTNTGFYGICCQDLLGCITGQMVFLLPDQN